MSAISWPDRRREWSTEGHGEFQAEGGAGFGAQWDVGFIRGVRPALEAANDAHRDVAAVAVAMLGTGRGPALTRVIYTESHDDVANDRDRVPEAMAPGDAASWWAKKRATSVRGWS